MGILATLIVSPCITAPLAGVLSYIAKSSDYLLGMVGLFFMGIGMGLPLLIIGLCSENILPKAARWNKQIKHFFGLLMLGMSLYVASRVLTEFCTTLLLSAYLYLVVLYMGLFNGNLKGWFRKFLKAAGIMIFIYATFIYVVALLMNSGLTDNLRMTVGATSVASFNTIENKLELQQALKEAQKNHLPALIDFSASWCHSCKNLEKNVFNNPEVSPMLKKFYLIRVDVTNANDDSMALARQFNVAGPPVVLFFDENGKMIASKINGDVPSEQFMQTLGDVLHGGGG
jgi:thiol:disulfide interchange protein DsbD